MHSTFRTRHALAFTLVSLLSGAPAIAGTVEPDAEVCGMTVPFARPGEREPGFGIWGNSNKGIEKQFFFVKKPSAISKNLFTPAQTKQSVLADFVAAAHFKGLFVCLYGDLETTDNKRNPEKPIYNISPTGSKIMERTTDFLNATTLVGPFINTDRANLKVHVQAIDDPTVGKRFYIPELTGLIRLATNLTDSCADLDANSANQQNLSFRVYREGKTVLTARLAINCTSQTPIGENQMYPVFQRAPSDPSGTYGQYVLATPPSVDMVIDLTFEREKSDSNFILLKLTRLGNDGTTRTPIASFKKLF